MSAVEEKVVVEKRSVSVDEAIRDMLEALLHAHGDLYKYLGFIFRDHARGQTALAASAAKVSEQGVEVFDRQFGRYFAIEPKFSLLRGRRETVGEALLRARRAAELAHADAQRMREDHIEAIRKVSQDLHTCEREFAEASARLVLGTELGLGGRDLIENLMRAMNNGRFEQS